MYSVINDKISYLVGSDQPLSADIGIVREKDEIWLYDVGDGAKSVVELNEMVERITATNPHAIDGYHIVLSHFHQDHMGNIGAVPAKEIYASKETFKHVKMPEGDETHGAIARMNDTRWTVVDKELFVGNLHIFPLPSSHAKGCVGLEIDETYAFVGDALYCKARGGYLAYNVQHLQEEIKVLKSLKAPYLLVSHHPGLIRSKEECIAELEEIYGRRVKNEPEIRLKMWQ